MNVNKVLAKDYENIRLRSRGKNKPNLTQLKPIQTQFSPNMLTWVTCAPPTASPHYKNPDRLIITLTCIKSAPFTLSKKPLKLTKTLNSLRKSPLPPYILIPLQSSACRVLTLYQTKTCLQFRPSTHLQDPFQLPDTSNFSDFGNIFGILQKSP